MSANTTPFQIYKAPTRIEDPGDTNTIYVDRQPCVVQLISGASGETRTLARPGKGALQAVVGLMTDGGGDVTLTVTGGYDADGNTGIVFKDAGDCAIFVSVPISTTQWRWERVQQGGGTTSAVFYGSQANAAGSGIPLSSSQTGALKVFSDDNGANIADSARGIQSRLLMTVDASGSTIRALQGQLKMATGVDVTTGIYTAVQGYVEMAGTHIAATGSTFSCVDASMEITTSLTVNSGGEACGIHVETTGAGTITNNGTCAGVLIDKASSAASWPDGILIDGPSVVMGMRIGKFAGSAATTSAVLFTTTQNIYGDNQVSTFEVHGASSTDLGAGYAAKCIRARHVVQSTACAHETYGAMGQLVVKATTLTHLHAGVIGTFEGHTSGVVSTPAYRYGTSCVQARLGGGGAITATTPITGFSAVFNGAALGSGDSVAYALTNTAAGEWDYVFGVTHAGSGDHNGVQVVDGVAGDTGEEGTVGYDALMKIQIGTVAYYIALFDAGSVSGES